MCRGESAEEGGRKEEGEGSSRTRRRGVREREKASYRASRQSVNDQ